MSSEMSIRERYCHTQKRNEETERIHSTSSILEKVETQREACSIRHSQSVSQSVEIDQSRTRMNEVVKAVKRK